MKKNHKMRKIMLALFSAMLLVCVTIGATVAYLTDTKTVTNTFTVGNVAITLDEKDTDNSTSGAERDTANKYHILPGQKYEKDPIVHVTANSEDSYIFVKVENGIAAYEAATETTEGGYKTIAEQIAANGWTALDGVTNVYYKPYTKSSAVVDMPVFAEFKIAGNADGINGWANISETTTKVVVTAYAVQFAGFSTAKDAWDATFGASN